MVILGLSLTAVSLIITFFVVKHNKKRPAIIEQEEIAQLRYLAEQQREFNNRYGHVQTGVDDRQYFVPPGVDVTQLRYQDPWTMSLPGFAQARDYYTPKAKWKHGQPILDGTAIDSTRVRYWDAVKQCTTRLTNLTKLPPGSKIPVYKAKKK